MVKNRMSDELPLDEYRLTSYPYFLSPMMCIGGKTYGWYSICSVHRSHNAECDMCNVGSWHEQRIVPPDKEGERNWGKKVKYIQRDITTIERNCIIAHGVNCQRVMGSGVARAIKNKWPVVYKEYMDTDPKLGQAHIVVADPRKMIHVANCYTQEYYGPGDKQYASEDAIRTSLESVFSWAGRFNFPVYLPQIGSGLGGLDWNSQVRPIVDELNSKYPTVNTYVCVLGGNLEDPEENE